MGSINTIKGTIPTTIAKPMKITPVVKEETQESQSQQPKTISSMSKPEPVIPSTVPDDFLETDEPSSTSGSTNSTTMTSSTVSPSIETSTVVSISNSIIIATSSSNELAFSKSSKKGQVAIPTMVPIGR